MYDICQNYKIRSLSDYTVQNSLTDLGSFEFASNENSTNLLNNSGIFHFKLFFIPKDDARGRTLTLPIILSF